MTQFLVLGDRCLSGSGLNLNRTIDSLSAVMSNLQKEREIIRSAMDCFSTVNSTFRDSKGKCCVNFGPQKQNKYFWKMN